MKNYTFTKSIPLKIKSFIIVILLLLIIELVLYALVVNYIGEGVITPVIGYLIIYGFALAYISLYIYNEFIKPLSISIEDYIITIKKGNKVIITSNIKDDQYTYSINKQYTNGIKTTTSFDLIIIDSYGKQKKINCNSIGIKAFNVMMSIINSYDLFSRDNNTFTPTSYNLNKSNASFILRKRILIMSIVIFIAVMIPGFLLVISSSSSNIMIGSIFAMLIIYLVSIFIIIFRHNIIIKKIPTQISLQQHKICIDENTYYYKDLINIITVPSTTTSNMNNRPLKIITNTITEKFYLGYVSDYKSKNPVFNEYTNFVYTLESALSSYPGVFLSDLDKY